jgi:histidinol-phosphatase (PHP family)
MLPADNHVHSQWSWDTWTDASMHRACERALEVGVPAVAFTEHVDFVVWGDDDPTDHGLRETHGRERLSPLDVAGYFECVAECRERYPDLRIWSGIEAGEAHLFAGSLAAVRAQGSFDRILGSLHAVPYEGRLTYADRLYQWFAPEEVMRRYFAELLNLIAGSDVFQVLAHCDFPRRGWPGPRPYEEKVFEEEYRAVFRALAASGRALEINTRSPLWSVSLVRWWREEGGAALSFGSDAHVHGRVGARFAQAVEVAEAAGFRPGRDAYDFWRR